jgi:hypothetical protein
MIMLASKNATIEKWKICASHKAYQGVKVLLRHSTLDGRWVLRFDPRSLYPQERVIGIHRIRGSTVKSGGNRTTFPRLGNLQPSFYIIRAIGNHNTQHTTRSQCAEKSDNLLSLMALKASIINFLCIFVLQGSEMMQNHKNVCSNDSVWEYKNDFI